MTLKVGDKIGGTKSLFVVKEMDPFQIVFETKQGSYTKRLVVPLDGLYSWMNYYGYKIRREGSYINRTKIRRQRR